MKTKLMDDVEVKLRGIEILNKSLGATTALRFLKLFHREPTDYVEISRRIYKDQTIDDIFTRAKREV